MATLLSRIFGKKTAPGASAPENDQLDIRALKPLMEPKAPVSTDPKDLSGAWTMGQVTTIFPSAQRALFQRYHVGGCSSCGFSPEETLAGVCARNDDLNVEEVVEHIVTSHHADEAIQIDPRELAERIAKGEKVYLLDVRTREEWEAVKLPNSHLFTQELMQDILARESRTDLLVIYDHKGTRSMDAAAFFQGHGFENVKSLRGGIDAWSAEVDSALPRYHLE